MTDYSLRARELSSLVGHRPTGPQGHCRTVQVKQPFLLLTQATQRQRLRSAPDSCCSPRLLTTASNSVGVASETFSTLCVDINIRGREVCDSTDPQCRSVEGTENDRGLAESPALDV